MIGQAKNYLLAEVKHNDLKSEKYKNTCKCLSYVEHFSSTAKGSLF